MARGRGGTARELHWPRPGDVRKIAEACAPLSLAPCFSRGAFYHVTSAAAAERIRTEGLLPRAATGQRNFGIAADADGVYLWPDEQSAQRWATEVFGPQSGEQPRVLCVRGLSVSALAPDPEALRDLAGDCQSAWDWEETGRPQAERPEQALVDAIDELVDEGLWPDDAEGRGVGMDEAIEAIDELSPARALFLANALALRGGALMHRGEIAPAHIGDPPADDED